ncbi:cation transporter, partial [Pseudomonas syringae pv. actinidiae]|nr:cation transporter [Pseudomonas syringae pv. actinidiae]
MNYQDFTDHAQAGRVEELNLISIEGGIYLLDVRMNGTSV